MRDLTPLLNLLAAYQLKARRLERIANGIGYNAAIILQQEEAFYAARPIQARIAYLASFISTLS
jgi:hypothetical protein